MDELSTLEEFDMGIGALTDGGCLEDSQSDEGGSREDDPGPVDVN